MDNIRVLRYFLAVAREQSISGAAELLHVTQPTLSRQLMDLEEELGAKLFIRGNRKISLTEKGMLLRKRATEIIDLVNKTEQEFHAPEELIGGDVYIGGGETDAMGLVAQVAKKLQEDYPQIRYHLFSGNADDVTERLDKGLLDFGILIEPADVRKYDFLRLPANDTWGVLMRKDSHLAGNDVIRPQDLWDLPLITSQQTLIGSEFSKWFAKDYEELNIVTTYNLVYNATLMVKAGVGYALCLDKLVNTSGSSELCFRPLSPGLDARLDIVWKKYQIFSTASQKFLQRLQQEFTEADLSAAE